QEREAPDERVDVGRHALAEDRVVGAAVAARLVAEDLVVGAVLAYHVEDVLDRTAGPEGRIRRRRAVGHRDQLRVGGLRLLLQAAPAREAVDSDVSGHEALGRGPGGHSEVLARRRLAGVGPEPEALR